MLVYNLTNKFKDAKTSTCPLIIFNNKRFLNYHWGKLHICYLSTSQNHSNSSHLNNGEAYSVSHYSMKSCSVVIVPEYSCFLSYETIHHRMTEIVLNVALNIYNYITHSFFCDYFVVIIVHKVKYQIWDER